LFKGLTQELKEAKKKIETLKDDLCRTKKLNSEETSNLTFHYEQRVTIKNVFHYFL
jgi:predicted RNase H-like nuclease (RuvC/YqgF family)